MGSCLLSFVRTASAKGVGRSERECGGGFDRVCSFVIGSFVAKNLEILLTYKYVRVCLVSTVYCAT